MCSSTTGKNVLRGYMEAQTTVDYALGHTIRNLSAQPYGAAYIHLAADAIILRSTQ